MNAAEFGVWAVLATIVFGLVTIYFVQKFREARKGDNNTAALIPAVFPDAKERLQAAVEVERNYWSSWNALASTALALTLGLVSVLSFLYDQYRTSETNKQELTRDYSVRWNEVLRPTNRQQLMKMELRCKGYYQSHEQKAEFENWVLRVRSSPDDPDYIEYATVIEIMNFFERMAADYNRGRCLTRDVEEEYASSIVGYVGQLQPLIEAAYRDDQDRKDVKQYWIKEDVPWYELQLAKETWEKLLEKKRKRAESSGKRLSVSY
jgi:hypothetical protein